MPDIPIFIVDAFADGPFTGNPAGVCPLATPVPEAWMQQVAAELNLSETAFVTREADGFHLRWFTPTDEVALCGHATMATAQVLWDTGILPASEPARFRTMSGILVARRAGTRVELDLPAFRVEAAPLPAGCAGALGATPQWTGRTTPRGGEAAEIDYLILVDSDREVRALRPDFRRLREVQAGLIVTAGAASGAHDFVSRYFAPYCGIDEDPVTGVAHCTLVPFWSARLGKGAVVGYQASRRGGTVHGRQAGDRVHLSGDAVIVVRGTLGGAAGPR